jgi:hypothetical protein
MPPAVAFRVLYHTKQAYFHIGIVAGVSLYINNFAGRISEKKFACVLVKVPKKKDARSARALTPG